jgi:4-aminobutyrate aminotransferase-like enzyme
LWENSAAVGAYLFEKLRALRSPWIGDIRGAGLLIGMEIVTDANKTPLPEARMVQLQREMREAGVLVGRNNDSVPGYCNVLILSPPLTLNREQADTLVGAIEGALARL